MAEQHGEDKYIKCSKCKCKYINDDEQVEIGDDDISEEG